MLSLDFFSFPFLIVSSANQFIAYASMHNHSPYYCIRLSKDSTPVLLSFLISPQHVRRASEAVPMELQPR
jgi:hypothetical protein